MPYVGKFQVGLTANKVHEDWRLQVARGDITGVEHVNIFGRNEDADLSSAPEDVWGPGGDVNFPASAAQLNVASSSANDTAAGTGARSLFIRGLNANWDTVEEVVDLNGQTIVQTANAYIRVNRISVRSVGSGGVAAGNVSIFSGAATSGVPDDASQIWRQIPANRNVCQCAFYSVPRNHEAFIYSVFAMIRRGTSGSAWADIELQVRDNASINALLTANAFEEIRDVEVNDLNPAQISNGFPNKIPEYADFKVRGLVGSANNLIITAQVDFLLVQKRIEVPPLAEAVI